MTRSIQLTKLHALNWYGYRDTLPVRGNLVLAGVTGSGKSILMDLLMLVLVGPERARHHFNRSATGSRSDRTIKGYCLLDTKREENGQPQFFHDKGVTTYIAAEFTWPDGLRCETWGLRFEFRSSSETDGLTTPFYCPAALEKDDFLTVSPEDGKKRPLGQAAFRAMIEAKGGRLFASSREYLRDMANPSHLNFNKDVLERLLPSAMSFTNLKSFDDFCRQFVLPGEAVDVDDVVSSFRDFESYERELRELRSQLGKLTSIRSHGEAVATGLRDEEVAHWLVAELALQQAREDVSSMEKRLGQLREQHAADEARLNELEALTSSARDERERLLALLNESAEGRLYKRMADEIREMENEIDRLRAIAAKIEGGLRQRVKSARQWMDEVSHAPVHPRADTLKMEEALAFLDSCERAETGNALALLAEAANKLCQVLQDRFRNDREELRRLRGEKSSLDAQVAALRRGHPPEPQPLLQALRESIDLLPGEPAPRALRELCEVEDESWRAAAESALEEKFAVLVDSGHFARAAVILRQLTEADLLRAPQRLLDAGALQLCKPKRMKNSLAEIFRAEDPAARAWLDQRFGEVIRVADMKEFLRQEQAILPDGMTKNGGTVTRPKPYDGMPFIGENGLKRQLEIKLARLGEVDAALRRLEPIEREIQRLLDARESAVPNHDDIGRELVRVESLPARELEHEKRMTELMAISTDEFSRMEATIEELKEQVTGMEREKLSILRKGGHREIEQSEKMLEARRLDASRKEDEFSRLKLRLDITRHLTRYQEWGNEMASLFPPLDVRIREFSKAAEAAREQRLCASGDLKAAMVDFKKSFQPKFDELPEDGHDTSAYDRILSRIESANIPEYERKAALERKRWESLFRTQVLSRMQMAIKEIENIIARLNQQLRRPIGHDRYRIERRPNPDFRVYRELIDLNAVHHEDELFFASMGGELKDALQQFLVTLVKNANGPEAARLLDYRQYFDYDLLVTDIRDPDARAISVDKQSGKMSGGENQSPYFVAILASYLHAYNRHGHRRKEPSLALVPIDEAFSKLSGERILNCLQAMAELDLQGMFSMSSGNIPYAFSQCDQLIIISRKEERRGSRIGVRNVPVILYRESPEGQAWIKARGLDNEV